jgi:hypothetical protein
VISPRFEKINKNKIKKEKEKKTKKKKSKSKEAKLPTFLLTFEVFPNTHAHFSP